MVVEDEIRAKGLGVVLDGSIDEERNHDLIPRLTHLMIPQSLEERYFRARFEACRDALWLSVTLNVILLFWITWAFWRR